MFLLENSFRPVLKRHGFSCHNVTRRSSSAHVHSAAADWLAYARDVMCVGNTSWKLEFFYSCDWWFFSTATDADRRSYTQVTKKSATDLFPIIVAQAQLDPKKVVADWSVSSQCRPEGTFTFRTLTIRSCGSLQSSQGTRGYLDLYQSYW